VNDTAAMRGHPFGWWAALALASLVLLWPAFYNGFPIVFPDTGAYFSVAWGHFWTMDRSGFYGFFLRSLSFLPPLAQLWSAIALQTVAITAVIFMVCRKMLHPFPVFHLLAIVALLSMFTPLAWHAAQLMPDAFTGIVVLLVWLACSQDVSDSGAPTLWFAAYAAGLLHYTHVILVLAAGGATLLVQLALRSSTLPATLRRASACALVASAILGTQFAANGAFLSRWSPAPLGSMFLFARLHEDGLVQPWLAEHCAEGQTPLVCRAEPSFPRGSQELLWGNASPLPQSLLNSSRTNTNPLFVAELREAAIGAIAERPLEFGRDAAQKWGKQLVHFQVLDDECPEVCRAHSSALYGWIRDFRPELLGPLLRSSQLSGTIPKLALRWMTTPVSILALLLVPWLFIETVRRRDAVSSSLLATVAAALLANALVTGALSGVHDRYQSRLIWLAPFAVALVIMRWQSGRRSQQKEPEQFAPVG